MFLPSVYTIDQMEFHSDELLLAINCSDLNCLRQICIGQLQAANVAVPYPGQSKVAFFGYDRVIDGSLFLDRPTDLIKQGKFSKDKPLIMGSSHTEGSIFAPQVNTTEEVNSFMSAQFPGLTNSTLNKLNALYGDNPPIYRGVQVTRAPMYYCAAEMFGDSALLCPAFNLGRDFADAGVSVQLYVDSIVDAAELAAGYIVPHTWDVQAVWGPSYVTNYIALPNATSYEPGQSNSGIVPIVQAYWTSFARSGDPNTFKFQSAPNWNSLVRDNFLNIRTNTTVMEYVSKELSRKCKLWKSASNQTRQ